MHRVKGLEFDGVFAVGVNQEHMPLAMALSGYGDEVGRENAETRERSLLYVTATRAKKLLLLSFHGTLSPYFTIKR